MAIELALATAGFCATNIGLLSAMLFHQVKNYRVLKSSFSKGLIVFSGFLLLQNAIYMGSYLFEFGYYTGRSPIIPHIFAVNLAQLVGLAALARITLR